MTKEALSVVDTLKLALEALKDAARHLHPAPKQNEAITAIKEALMPQSDGAQPAVAEQHKQRSVSEHLEPVACNKEMKAQAKQAYPHDEKRELAFIDGWLSREAAHHQNPATTDWGAVHDKLMDVWHHELSADEGLDEIQGLINTTSPQPKEPEQEPVACPECKRLEDELEHAKIKATVWKSAYDVEVGCNEQDTTPPQRTWVGLTDEEIRKLCVTTYNGYESCRLVEAKLKEKNERLEKNNGT